MINDIGFHQNTIVGNGTGDHIQMHRCDLGLTLTDGGLHHFRGRCTFGDDSRAFGIIQRKWQIFIEQKVIQCLLKSLSVQAHSNIGKGRVTGFCKGLLKADLSVTGTVITTDFAVSHPERTITVIRIILIRGGILPDIFQCRYDLEGGSGRIKSLGGAVQQYCTGIIVDQIIPDLRNGIRIKIGMRHHCQNLAGADAIYLGGSRFGARAYAENFSEEELVACIRYAHLFQRKVYLTVNTLVKESEFSGLYEYVLPYYRAGLDGVIVQDMGVFAYLREHFPGMELHGSTQMTITGEYGAAFLKEQGACRVVPARELSLAEIRRIKEVTGLEIECFIHGAMCYCYSGQCLFSSILGGRSGNRGRCAQPCRLPYTTGKHPKECYPLSLKDMCTIEYIPELLEAGIDSFKIEGRMKKPEYAAGVTAIYRKYIDQYYADSKAPQKISAADMHTLSCLYIRSERQDGYYHKHNGGEMVTLDSPAYSGSDETLLQNIRKKHLEHRLTLPVSMQAEFLTGETAKLYLWTGESAVTVEGNVVEEASRQPITQENIAKQLGKLGDSHFHLEDSIGIRVSDNAFYPLKAINELRRKGLSLLEEQVILANGFLYERTSEKAPTLADDGDFRKNDSIKSQKSDEKWAITIRTPEQWQGFCSSSFWKDPVRTAGQLRLYLDADFLLQDPSAAEKILRSLTKKEIQSVIALPKILRLRDGQYLEKLRKLLLENLAYINGFQAANMEHIALLKQWNFTGKEIYGDHSLYLWNRTSRDFWKAFLDGYCLPLELNAAEQRDILDPAFPAEKVIYGRIPMMVTANCVQKTTDRCQPQENPKALDLIDRYHKRFPVQRNCTHCFNVIYNSVPLSLHKELCKWSGLVTGRLDFTTENETETLEVLEYFAGTRKELPYGEYTTGHEKRGVE
jgi:U32 family peptidase